ncbi:hypothetical protein [Priestia aryabhattai]|uniref:hypothetical protein n=1 Tax=Priestia aryabhattai TaxID=412384 RepID=UPI000BFE1094|nr:hypothetical protein [Priestia aryabhattai]PHF65851.1 hypothetical protein COI42_23375 [Priestia aryabhattai]
MTINIKSLSIANMFPNNPTIQSNLDALRSKYNFPSSITPKRQELIELIDILEELFNYFHNDILVSAATFETVKLQPSYTIKTIGYHAENTLSRIVSLWDYLFILLNEYLGTQLLASYQIRDKILKAEFIDFTFVKSDEGTYNALVKPINLSKIEKMLHIKKLSPSLKVFKLHKNNKNNNMYRAFKKEFQPTSKIDDLFALYKQHSESTCKEIRNEIIHQRSLGFAVSFSGNLMDLPIRRPVVNINRNGWKDFDELFSDVETNLNLLFQGLNKLYKILKDDDFPNALSLNGRVFTLRNYYCKNCSSTFSIPEELSEDILKKFIVCPKCLSHKQVKKQNTETTHERDYYDRLVGSLELISNLRM